MKRRYHLHAPGILLIGLIVLVGLAAINTQQNLLFWVFGLMLSGLLISGMMSGYMMMRLRARRLDPQNGAVGEPMSVRYEITNTSRWLPAFNVHVEDLPVEDARGWQHFARPALTWVMHIGPRETVHAESTYWPARRGEMRFHETRLWTTFPLGIIKKSVTFTQPQHTLIFPRQYELRHRMMDSIRPDAPMGIRVAQHAGAGDDYYGMREYRPGDSMRHISWKRTARLDQLISIERSNPSPPKLRVVLDFMTPREELRIGPKDLFTAEKLEERAISLAASIIQTADHAGFEVGLSLLGIALPPIQIRRSQWHLRKILAALAAIDLDVAREPSIKEGVNRQERAGLVVITPDRIRPLASRPDAWYLSARQMDDVVVKPLGVPGDELMDAAAPSQEAAA